MEHRRLPAHDVDDDPPDVVRIMAAELRAGGAKGRIVAESVSIDGIHLRSA